MDLITPNNEQTPANRKVFIQTFGCQMNVYDSGKMLAQLREDGFTPTDSAADADLVLINTCSVREKPEHKLHSTIGSLRKLRKNHPFMIGITGCMAQHAGASLFQKYRDVDLVIGPDAVPRIRQLVEDARTQRVLDNQFLEVAEYPFVQQLDPAAAHQVTGLVTIQKGCDNKCTFCIVPMTRGQEVSRPSAQIVDEVRRLTEQGVRDVTLIGQNVNSYGLKTGEIPFAELLYRVAEVPGLARLRYTTSHPRDMGEDVVQAYRDLPNLASHLHLPAQTGSNRLLRRMKRFYTRERFLEVASQLRDARPDLSLTTDLIVGFPGETDEDFEQTLELMREAPFDGSFSFRYSPRPGTAALRLREKHDDAQALERLHVLQRLQAELSLAGNQRMEGRQVEVLVEKTSRQDDAVLAGRTSCFRTVNFAGPTEMIGTLQQVRVLRGYTNSLRGELVDSVTAPLL